VLGILYELPPLNILTGCKGGLDLMKSNMTAWASLFTVLGISPFTYGHTQHANVTSTFSIVHEVLSFHALRLKKIIIFRLKNCKLFPSWQLYFFRSHYKITGSLQFNKSKFLTVLAVNLYCINKRLNLMASWYKHNKSNFDTFGTLVKKWVGL
jgi:hypothetical protein